MLRLKLRGLGVLAALVVLGVSGVAASSASANFVLTEKKCESGRFINLCWSKEAPSPLFELEGEETLEGVNVGTGAEAVLLEATVGELVVHVICEKASLVLASSTVTQKPLTENTRVTIRVLVQGCKLLEPLAAKCTIPVEKETEPLTGTPLSKTTMAFTGPGGATGTIISIVLTGSLCPLKGTKLLTGTQVVTLSNAEPATEHEAVATEKSELLLAENAASLKLALKVKLDNISPDFWDAVEND